MDQESGRMFTATALFALAGDLEEIGVPEDHIERVRDELLTMARALGQGDPDWATLRRATAAVMEYPELGRKAVPLLLPYFEIAA
jgi:hypothetical protein